MIPMPNRILFSAHSILRFPERIPGVVLDHRLRSHIRSRFSDRLRRGITPTLRGSGGDARLTYVMELSGEYEGGRVAVVLESWGWVVATVLPRDEGFEVVTEQRAVVPWPNLERYAEQRGEKAFL